MMKRFLSILLCSLMVMTLWGQKRLLQPEISFGAQGGYMASMVQFSPTVNQQPLKCFLGPTAGLVFRYAEHKVCGVQVELNYMQRGWREVQTGYVRQLDYIELPLLCHLSFGRRFRGFINLGPQIGYLVHEQQNDASLFPNAWTDQLDSKTAHQYAPAEKPFDWGLAGGLGVYYRSRVAGTYQIEARFNYSLGAVFGSSQMDYFANSNHMNLSLTFAYLWEFKRKK